MDEDFYRYYLNEHRHMGTRVLHFIGTTLFLLSVPTAIITKDIAWLVLGIAAAYGLAWIGHFFIEKNRPATFKCPGASLLSDFRMYYHILRGGFAFDRKNPKDAA